MSENSDPVKRLYWVRAQGEYSEFFYRYVGSGYFLGLNFLNFNIFGDFQKNEYFWGYDDFVDIFGVITKLAYIKGSFLCILGSFLRKRFRVEDIFGVC